MDGMKLWLRVGVMAGVVVFGAGIGLRADEPMTTVPAKAQVVGMKESIADTQVREKLDETLDVVDFQAFRLSTVLDYLRRTSALNFKIDWTAFEELGVAKDTPVTLELNNAKVRDVLDLVLTQVSPKDDPEKLIAFKVENGFVRIGPKRLLEKRLRRTYASMPEGVSSFGAVADGGWLYVYGGHLDKTHTYSAQGVSGKFHRLNLKDGKTWEELPGGPALQGMNLAAYAGKIYRVGGMQPQNKKGEKSDNKSLADVSVYDPVTKKWEALPALPVARSSHDVAVVEGKLYVIGGWTQLGGDAKPTWPTEMVVLDLEKPGDGWKTLKQPFERRAFIAGVLDGKIYVMGGLDKEAKRLQLTEVYDPKADAWSHGPRFPDGDRNGFAPCACVMNGSLYMNLADGAVMELRPQVSNVRYVDPAEKSQRPALEWVKVGASQPRIVGRMVSNGDQLLVVGGSSKVGEGRMMNEIEVVEVGK